MQEVTSRADVLDMWIRRSRHQAANAELEDSRRRSGQQALRRRRVGRDAVRSRRPRLEAFDLRGRSCGDRGRSRGKRRRHSRPDDKRDDRGRQDEHRPARTEHTQSDREGQREDQQHDGHAREDDTQGAKLTPPNSASWTICAASKQTGPPRMPRGLCGFPGRDSWCRHVRVYAADLAEDASSAIRARQRACRGIVAAEARQVAQETSRP